MSKRTTEDEAVLPRRPARVPVLRVLLHAGGASPPPRALRAGVTPIGREVEAPGVALPEDSRVSRRHAIVRLDGDVARLVDEGSRNGTFVNGLRVSERGLRDGDVVRVGGSFLLLRYEPQEPAPADLDEDEAGGIVGVSPAMRGLRAALRRVGPGDATVLLLGESGAGKDVAARALHRESGRAGPFVAVNCAAIPESLAESQLFGHVAGAFTGAAPHPGLFRAAHGGTLFLDEIGEMPAALQAKLLRAIEERAVVPVGAVAPVRCDVRLVAATNQDLGRAVAEGRFRGDLYARLSGVPLRLPPLRERREDVLPLLRLGAGGALPPMTTELVEALLLHGWPYNVRELFKVAESLRVRGGGPEPLGPEVLTERLAILAQSPATAPRLQSGVAPALARPAPRAAPSRERLEDLLRANDGNISGVAREMGRSRRQVSRWLDRHELQPERFRRGT